MSNTPELYRLHSAHVIITADRSKSPAYVTSVYSGPDHSRHSYTSSVPYNDQKNPTEETKHVEPEVVFDSTGISDKEKAKIETRESQRLERASGFLDKLLKVADGRPIDGQLGKIAGRFSGKVIQVSGEYTFDSSKDRPIHKAVGRILFTPTKTKEPGSAERSGVKLTAETTIINGKIVEQKVYIKVPSRFRGIEAVSIIVPENNKNGVEIVMYPSSQGSVQGNIHLIYTDRTHQSPNHVFLTVSGKEKTTRDEIDVDKAGKFIEMYREFVQYARNSHVHEMRQASALLASQMKKDINMSRNQAEAFVLTH